MTSGWAFKAAKNKIFLPNFLSKMSPRSYYLAKGIPKVASMEMKATSSK